MVVKYKGRSPFNSTPHVLRSRSSLYRRLMNKTVISHRKQSGHVFMKK